MDNAHNSRPVLQVLYLTEDRTVRYAAEELARCLSQMVGDKIDAQRTETQEGGGVRVGLISDLLEIAPQVAGPNLADAVYIDVVEGRGCIAGTNPRAVLFAVYRYLTELGCRWVRPGADGEYIPARETLPPVKLAETPSYRHRGICIEGANSVQHVKDIIDWMPKIGFNGYFTQFRESYTFFDHWYSHDRNPLLQGREISIAEARGYLAEAQEEIKKRGLLYHAVGHGWTCEPLGISGLAWEPYEEEVPQAASRYFAEINGERKLWGGIPLNTNLCYGNPEVRRLIVNEITSYAVSHPEIDLLHFWLADGMNNHCECELCRDTRPSDLYLRMLNELDALLSQSGIPTRIVFLIYVDLLWPPLEEKIYNPDRFVLMFAPITRTYSEAFAPGDILPDLPPFVRNKLDMPHSVEQNTAFLRAWQKVFSGDSFDFDYHLMWDHYHDPGYYAISEIINRDVKGLRDLGLDGYVSCQTQRAFFPTGLPMVVLGRTLWNRDADFESLAADYFASAFGPDGALCREYVAKLSDLFDPAYLRGEKPQVDPEAEERFHLIPDIVQDFIPVIERNLDSPNTCWSKSWLYMKQHADYCTMFAGALEARARGDNPGAAERWERLVQMVREREDVLHPVFDLWVFSGTAGQRFRTDC